MARIGMTLLPRRVQQYVFDTHNVTVEPPSYRALFNAAVAGRFPAELANNRWTVDEADLPKVAEAFKLVPLAVTKSIAAPAKASRKTPTASPIPVAA